MSTRCFLGGRHRAGHLVDRGGLFHALDGTLVLKERRHPEGGHHDVYDSRFYRGLKASIGWAVRHRIVVLMVTGLVFAGSLYGFKFIPKSFFPQIPPGRTPGVDLWLPEGSGIGETERQAAALEKRLTADPDQSYVASFIGEGAPRFYLPLDQQLRNPNFAQLLIVAKDLPARERLIAKTRTWLAEDFPSVRFKVDRLFNGPPVGWAVQMRVSGPDRAEVRRIADRVKEAFREDPRVSNIDDDWLEPVPTLKLSIDQDRARALGISSQTIRRSWRGRSRARRSAPSSERTVAIMVREPAETRSLLSAIDGIYVPTDRGGWLARPGRQAGDPAGVGRRMAAQPAADHHGARRGPRRHPGQRRDPGHLRGLEAAARGAAGRLRHRDAGRHRGIGQEPGFHRRQGAGHDPGHDGAADDPTGSISARRCWSS